MLIDNQADNASANWKSDITKELYQKTKPALRSKSQSKR